MAMNDTILNGKPLIRMGELILPLSAALEFYDKDKELVR